MELALAERRAIAGCAPRPYTPEHTGQMRTGQDLVEATAPWIFRGNVAVAHKRVFHVAAIICSC